MEQDNVPVWNGKPGRYEVWFLTISDGERAYWIRSTLLAPEHGAPEARLWFARFDREHPERTFGVNRAVGIDRFKSGSDGFEIHLGDAVMRSGHAQGAITGGGHEVSWTIDYDTGAPTYRLLPDRLYHGGLAPTKPFSPNVRTAFTGRITIDGEAHQISGMPGQQGHLYGTRHAERWAWVHCGAFHGQPEVAVHALCAQGRRGPVKTPYMTFAGVRWEGRWLRLAGTARKRPFWLGGWRIDLSDRRYRLTGRVAGDPALMVQAEYHDPDGTPRFCHNTEVASSRWVLFERGELGFEEIAVLASEGTTHAEWAGRTPAPGEFARHVSVDPAA
ncbi:MAG: hypothetical protein ABR600_11180 [Actinomycetota bacterium]